MRLAREPAGTRAAYDGVPGHPVVLGGELAAAALDLEGDEGARGFCATPGPWSAETSRTAATWTQSEI